MHNKQTTRLPTSKYTPPPTKGPLTHTHIQNDSHLKKKMFGQTNCRNPLSPYNIRWSKKLLMNGMTFQGWILCEPNIETNG